MQNTTHLNQYPNLSNSAAKFATFPAGDHKFNTFLDTVSSARSKNQQKNSTPSIPDEYARAKKCISCIADPLWKDVCASLLNIMGSASVLKIWKSNLGEFSPQEKLFDLTCESEEVAAFIRKYEFVILGSLQRYFPALKQLRVQTIANAA